MRMSMAYSSHGQLLRDSEQTKAPVHQYSRVTPQHSTMLTARPPRAVSLYFTDMSAPVETIVAITLSRETLCLPSPESASRAALIAFTLPMALRSMHGTCTSPPMGSQVRPRL